MSCRLQSLSREMVPWQPRNASNRVPQSKPSFASRYPPPSTAEAFVYAEYDITDAPLDNRHIQRLPAQVQVRIDDLYELAQHDPVQAIPELEHLVTTYPPYSHVF